jgi:hypothetical protein
MSVSKRDSRTDFENMREEKLQKFILGGVQRQNFFATMAPIQCQAILISYSVVHILIKGSNNKTRRVVAKMHKYIFCD